MATPRKTPAPKPDDKKPNAAVKKTRTVAAKKASSTGMAASPSQATPKPATDSKAAAKFTPPKQPSLEQFLEENGHIPASIAVVHQMVKPLMETIKQCVDNVTQVVELNKQLIEQTKPMAVEMPGLTNIDWDPDDARAGRITGCPTLEEANRWDMDTLAAVFTAYGLNVIRDGNKIDTVILQPQDEWEKTIHAMHTPPPGRVYLASVSHYRVREALMKASDAVSPLDGWCAHNAYLAHQLMSIDGAEAWSKIIAYTRLPIAAADGLDDWLFGFGFNTDASNLAISLNALSDWSVEDKITIDPNNGGITWHQANTALLYTIAECKVSQYNNDSSPSLGDFMTLDDFKRKLLERLEAFKTKNLQESVTMTESIQTGEMTQAQIRAKLRSYGLLVGLNPDGTCHVNMPNMRQFQESGAPYTFEDVETAFGLTCEKFTDVSLMDAKTYSDFIKTMLGLLATIPCLVSPEPPAEAPSLLQQVKDNVEATTAALASVAACHERNNVNEAIVDVERAADGDGLVVGVAALDNFTFNTVMESKGPENTLSFQASEAMLAFASTGLSGLNAESYMAPSTDLEKRHASVEFFERYGLSVVYDKDTATSEELDVFLPNPQTFGYVGGRIGGLKTRYTYDTVSMAYNAAREAAAKDGRVAVNRELRNRLLVCSPGGMSGYKAEATFVAGESSQTEFVEALRIISGIAEHISRTANSPTLLRIKRATEAATAHGYKVQLHDTTDAVTATVSASSAVVTKLVVAAVNEMTNTMNFRHSAGRTQSDTSYVEFIGVFAAGAALPKLYGPDMGKTYEGASLLVFAHEKAAKLGKDNTERIDAILRGQPLPDSDSADIGFIEPVKAATPKPVEDTAAAPAATETQAPATTEQLEKAFEIPQKDLDLIGSVVNDLTSKTSGILSKVMGRLGEHQRRKLMADISQKLIESYCQSNDIAVKDFQEWLLRRSAIEKAFAFSDQSDASLAYYVNADTVTIDGNTAIKATKPSFINSDLLKELQAKLAAANGTDKATLASLEAIVRFADMIRAVRADNLRATRQGLPVGGLTDLLAYCSQVGLNK